MKKSLFFFSLSFVLLLVITTALVGCSGNSTPTNTETASSAPSTEESQAAVEPTQVESGQEDKATQAPADAGKDGEAILQASCSQCHSVNRVYSANYDAEGWKANIDRMIGKGAVISDEDASILIEFLLAQQ